MNKLFLILLCLPVATQAQDVGNYVGEKEWFSEEVALIVGLLVFTIFIITVEAVLIIKSQPKWEPDVVIKLLGLTLIVCFSVLLIAAQYDQDQTAPIIGLFGVIAGYLLGHEARTR